MPHNDPEIHNLKKALDELRIINNLILNISKIRETNHIMSVLISELIKITNADQGVINLVSAMKDEGLVTVARDIDRDESSVPFKVNK